MKIKFYLRLLVFTLLGLVNTQLASAQDVTIRANNGSCVAAVKNGGVDDTFFNVGGFATWQHEQLSMVMTASDGTKLTPNGQLDNPANNLFKSSDGTKMQIAHGQVTNANVCYLSISLPKGYRFTQYSIEFSKPYNQYKGRYSGNDVYLNPSRNASSTFGETNSSFDTYKTSDNYKPSASITTGGTQTITRKEVKSADGSSSDMGNVLYFKLELPAGERSMIQFENAVFYFTAEENYTPVTPASAMIEPMTAVDVPFSTSRVDFGTIANNSYNGTSRVSYSSANVHDLEANFTLFEESSVEAGTGIDGVSGNVVKYDTGGSISSSGGYFKLGKSAGQVYYIESPTYVEISDATSENPHKVPVGYRITGAEFEYTKSVDAVATRTFYITYEYEVTQQNWGGGTTTTTRKGYLNTNGRFTTTPVQWQMDEDGFISSGGYYLYFNNGYASTQRTKPADSERFGISDNGIYQLQYPQYYICFLDEETSTWGGTSHTYYGLISKDSGLRASYEEITTTTEESTVGDFTLEVYDKTGDAVYQTKSTATDGATGKITLTGLNNDAVKFKVTGTGLVRASLTLQALDPYLNRMEIACYDPQMQTETGPQKFTQTFTAQDFSVNGGEFYFYLPDDCNGHTVNVKFEDLYSEYLDESYGEIGSSKNTSRLNFVNSEHYQAFGASNNSLYNDKDEAADPQKERRVVENAGTAKFKFNNADEVGSSGGNMKEYAFSIENYTAAPNNGSFEGLTFTVTDEDQVKTRYVFTTDETAYNIAPTTAVQHRAYAYYEMIIHAMAKTYEPKIAFTKIYDEGKTLNAAGESKAYYGVTVTATDAAGKPGYASTKDVFEKIEKILNETKVDDAGNTDLPESSKQILYVDFSQLKGTYIVTDSEHQSAGDYSASNAANCLIFIPKGGSAPNDNVAAFTGTAGLFQAANNIVLTDKEPFFSPYKIEASSEKKIEYKRLITKDKYGKVQNASLILPFALKLEDGKHTNSDGTSFTLHTMKAGQTMQVKDEQMVAYFPPVGDDVTMAAANTPYLVKIDGNSSADGVTFTASQAGGTIEKTEGIMATDYTISGDPVTDVKAGATTYTFTPKGIYAGIEVAKDDNVFYFARNQFVSSADLSDNYSTAKIAPFRAYFATSSTGAKLSSFTPVFEDVMGDFTAIVSPEAVLDMDAPVYDLQGRMVATSYRKAKSLKSGMYVVNGVKIMVK